MIIKQDGTIRIVGLLILIILIGIPFVSAECNYVPGAEGGNSSDIFIACAHDVLFGEPVNSSSFVSSDYQYPKFNSPKYSDEYYLLGQRSANFYNYLSTDDSIYLSSGVTFVTSVGEFIELRRQTILMERQNELLMEQNALLKGLSLSQIVCKNKPTIAGPCLEWEFQEGSQ